MQSTWPANAAAWRGVLQRREMKMKTDDAVKTKKGSTLVPYLPLASLHPAMSDPIASSSSEAHGSWSFNLTLITKRHSTQTLKKHSSSNKNRLVEGLTQRSAEGWKHSHRCSDSLSAPTEPQHNLHGLKTKDKSSAASTEVKAKDSSRKNIHPLWAETENTEDVDNFLLNT